MVGSRIRVWPWRHSPFAYRSGAAKPYWVLLVVALWGTGCEGTRDAQGERQRLLPLLTLRIEPPPGRYVAPLAVTIEASHARAEIRYAFNASPGERTPRHPTPLRLRLDTTSDLFVVGEAPGYRPAQARLTYTLVHVPEPLTAGTCKVSVPELVAAGSVIAQLSYAQTASLMKIEVVLDGRAIPVAVTQPVGMVDVDLGLVAEGRHDLVCRLVSPANVNLIPFVSKPVDFDVDGTPPTLSWISPVNPLDRFTLPAEFLVRAADVYGVASVQFCRLGGPCLEAPSRGLDLYGFVRPFTDQDSVISEIMARAVDRVGHEAVASLSWRVDTQTGQAPSRLVVVTTATELTPGQVHPSLTRWIDADLTTLPPTRAVFPGHQEWFAVWDLGSVAAVDVYRWGQRLTLPIATQWIVYRPGAAALLAGAKKVALISDAWFEEARGVVDSYFFVRDDNLDGLWSDDEPVFVPAGGPVFSATGWFEDMVTQVVLVNPTSVTVQVECPVCVGTEDLVGTWINSVGLLSSQWTLIRGLGAAPTTVTFTAEAGATCLYYADRDGNRILDPGEARAQVQCANLSILLRERDGPLRLQQVDGGVFQIAGLTYGSSATGWVQLHAGNSLVWQEPRIWRDGGQAGLVVWGESFALPLTITAFGEGGESASLAATAAAPQGSLNVSGTVREAISDMPMPALVQVVTDRTATWLLTNSEGTFSDSVNGTQLLYTFAMVSGYGGEITTGTPSSLALRVYAPSNARRLEGRVLTSSGTPVTGVAVQLRADNALSLAVSDYDGRFAVALPQTWVTVTMIPQFGERATWYMALTQSTQTAVFELAPTRFVRGAGDATLGWQVRMPDGLWRSPLNVGSGVYAVSMTADSYARLVSGTALWERVFSPGAENIGPYLGSQRFDPAVRIETGALADRAMFRRAGESFFDSSPSWAKPTGPWELVVFTQESAWTFGFGVRGNLRLTDGLVECFLDFRRDSIPLPLPFVLRDVLFGSIVSTATMPVTLLLAPGIYEASALGIPTLFDTAGNPVRIQAVPGQTCSSVIWLP